MSEQMLETRVPGKGENGKSAEIIRISPIPFSSHLTCPPHFFFEFPTLLAGTGQMSRCHGPMSGSTGFGKWIRNEPNVGECSRLAYI
jgi:hypothetical protein